MGKGTEDILDVDVNVRAMCDGFVPKDGAKFGTIIRADRREEKNSRLYIKNVAEMMGKDLRFQTVWHEEFAQGVHVYHAISS